MRWREEYRTFFWLIFSLAVIYGLYVRTLRYGFTNWDDEWYVVKNPVVQASSLSALKTIWFDLSSETRHVLGNEYLPARDTTLMGIHSLLGKSPVVYHAANVILYLIACMLLFVLLLEFSKDLPAVCIATLLFALHPTHVETVAWVSEIKGLLSFVFFFAGLLFLIWRAHLQSAPLLRRLPWFLLATLCFILAVLSKSTAIVFLPLVLVLGSAGLWNPVPARLRRFTWLFFGFLTAIHLAITVMIGRNVESYRPWLGNNLFHHLLTLPTLFARYLRLTVFPYDLQVLTEVKPVVTLFDLRLFLSMATIGLLVALLVWAWKRSYRFLSIAVLWFVVSLLPVVQLVPYVFRFSGRYLFLPSVAVAFLWLHVQGRSSIRRNRIAFLTLGGAILAFFAFRSSEILPRWKNCERLWQAAAAQGQYTEVVLANQYDCFMRDEKYDQAFLTIATAIRRSPDHFPYRVDLGRIYLLRGDLGAAEKSFYQARKLGLPLPAFENNIGVIRMNQKRYREADLLFQSALTRSPKDALAWTNRGHVARFHRRIKRAMVFYRRAVLEDPGFSPAWSRLISLCNRYGTPEDRKELELLRRELGQHPRLLTR